MDPNYMHDPRDFYTIQHEIEKERIREEIAMERRLFEEVRREMMLEREMARAGRMSLPIDECFSMQRPASCRLMHPFNNRSLEYQFAFPGNRGMGFGHDALPPTLPHVSDVSKDEIRSALEANKKDKVIMLAKPDTNLCGSKRKASTPPAGLGELPLISSKKPNKWSCALCQVSATCERGLNEHLQGRKHKAKEAKQIRAQQMYSTSSLLKESGNKHKHTESRETAEREMKIEAEEESLELKMKDVEDSENKNEELPQKGLNAKIQKKGNDKLTSEKRSLPNRENFKFWCEDCQIGTHSAIVMKSHKSGRKHMARRTESKANGSTFPAITGMTILTPSKTSEKAEDEDVVAEERNEETTKIVIEKPEDDDVLAEEGNKETTAILTEKPEDEEVVTEEASKDATEHITEKIVDED